MRPPAGATVALVGNPNVGKSTVFGALTGTRQRMGNWPGTTVQITSGGWSAGAVELLDLPGTYSLVAQSPAEALVRDLLVDRAAVGGPDLVVAVLDAANLARNLYLLAQVLDTGVPVVVALTMVDIAAARGLVVDVDALAAAVGVPVVPVGARARAGLDLLAAAVRRSLPGAAPRPSGLGELIEPAVGELARRLAADPVVGERVAARWLAIELLTGTGTAEVPAAIGCRLPGAEVDRLRGQLGQRLAAGSGPGGSLLAEDAEDDLATAVAEQRYDWVHRVVSASVRRSARQRPTVSDRVDRVLTSRWWGLPTFLLAMAGMLAASTWLAAPLQDGLAGLLEGPVAAAAYRLLAWLRLEHTWVAGLVLDGLVAGAGQLLTFVPLMAIMFVALALLEDSGYLARAALATDRFLRLLGLPGQAFLPLVVGFGCNVPAVAATRTLTSTPHRVLATLLVPYVTCTARLVVYTMLASAVFGRHAGVVVFGMYLLSVVLVLLVGLALRHTAFRHQRREALVLELPPYRLPAVRVVAAQTWQRLAGFLRKAGGVIVATAALVWLLTAVPLGSGEFGDVEPSGSLYGGVSRTLAPAFAPAGFDDWRTTGALVTGLVAKEAVVSTLGQTHQAGAPERSGRPGGGLDASLRETFDRASGGHGTAAACAFLVFVLAYPPCAATIATQRAEIGPRWTALGVGMQLVVAWSLATLVFLVGRLFT